MKEKRSICHGAPVTSEVWISKTRRLIHYCGVCRKICEVYNLDSLSKLMSR